MEEFRSTLELESGWSVEDLEQAYADQLKIWDPERFAHDLKLQERAKKKTEEIHLAYTRLRAFSNGDPIPLPAPEPEPQPVAELPPGLRDLSDSFIFSSSFGRNTIFGTNAPPHVPGTSAAFRAIHHVLMAGLSLCAIATVCAVFLHRNPSMASSWAAGDSQPPAASTRSAEQKPAPLTVKAQEQAAARQPAIAKVAAAAAVGETPELVSPGKAIAGFDAVAARIAKRPALVTAAANCDPTLARKLLDEGAAPDAVDSDGETALIWAARRNCLAVARLLVERGANRSVKSANGFTPLAWAKYTRNVELQRALSGLSDAQTRRAARAS